MSPAWRPQSVIWPDQRRGLRRKHKHHRVLSNPSTPWLVPPHRRNRSLWALREVEQPRSNPSPRKPALFRLKTRWLQAPRKLLSTLLISHSLQSLPLRREKTRRPLRTRLVEFTKRVRKEIGRAHV